MCRHACMWTQTTCASTHVEALRRYQVFGSHSTLLNQGLLAEPRGHRLTGICLCLLLGGVNIRSYGWVQRDKGSLQPGILVWASGPRPAKTALSWCLAICSFFISSKEVSSTSCVLLFCTCVNMQVLMRVEVWGCCHCNLPLFSTLFTEVGLRASPARQPAPGNPVSAPRVLGLQKATMPTRPVYGCWGSEPALKLAWQVFYTLNPFKWRPLLRPWPFAVKRNNWPWATFYLWTCNMAYVGQKMPDFLSYS